MEPTITSLQNPKIKNLVKLRRRRQRDEQGLMLIDGKRPLSLALQNRFPIQTLYLQEDKRDQTIETLAQENQVPIQPVSPLVFQKIGYGQNPDGHLAVAPQPDFDLEKLPQPANPLYLVAEGLEKPGNLGAILRSADAAGLDGLILCNSRTDICNPNLIRASQGAFFTVSLAVSSEEVLLQWLREKSIEVLVATPEATIAYTQADMVRPTALVVGAEDRGLSARWRRQTGLRIPMAGQVDSLNVAQTATLLIFEAVRQRAQAG